MISQKFIRKKNKQRWKVNQDLCWFFWIIRRRDFFGCETGNQDQRVNISQNPQNPNSKGKKNSQFIRSWTGGDEGRRNQVFPSWVEHESYYRWVSSSLIRKINDSLCNSMIFFYFHGKVSYTLQFEWLDRISNAAKSSLKMFLRYLKFLQVFINFKVFFLRVEKQRTQELAQSILKVSFAPKQNHQNLEQINACLEDFYLLLEIKIFYS